MMVMSDGGVSQAGEGSEPLLAVEHTVALAIEQDELGAVEEAGEHGGGGSGVLSRPPQSPAGRLELITVAPTSISAGEDLGQILGCGRREIAHAELLNHEQGSPGQGMDQLLAGAGGGGVWRPI